MQAERKVISERLSLFSEWMSPVSEWMSLFSEYSSYRVRFLVRPLQCSIPCPIYIDIEHVSRSRMGVTWLWRF